MWMFVRAVRMSRVSLTVAVARLFLVLACVASLCSAFVVPTTRIGGSSFAQRQAVVAMPERQARSGAGSLSMMGGKVRITLTIYI